MRMRRTQVALAGIAVLVWLALPSPVRSADAGAAGAAPAAGSAPAALRCTDTAVEACTDAFESCTALLPWQIDAKAPEMEQCTAAYQECLEKSGC